MKTQRGARKFWWIFVLLLIAGAYIAWAIFRPLPAISPVYDPKISAPQTISKLTWPTKGQSAVLILDSDILETKGEQKPVAMASTAKVITALMLLRSKPLATNQQGPVYTITPADVALYNQYVAQDGTVLPVKAGLKLTQYQMLQAMMLPSANNIADAVAIWSYGSLPAYSKAANAYLKSQGIKNTNVGSDASGLSPDSTTTAEDLVKIGRLAMKHEVLSEVVSQKSATTIPGSALVKNVNTLLGKDGIVGIKTGTSTQAGGAFLGASKYKVNNKEVTIITSILGASTRPEALASSQNLIKSAQNNFTQISISENGETIGTYSAPWGEKRTAILQKDIQTTAWKGEKIISKVTLNAVKPAEAKAGKVEIQATSASTKKAYDVNLDKPFNKPTLWWRLTHPF